MKILIYWPEVDLRSIGGPSGYLSNIKEYLFKDTDISFFFLQSESFFNSKASKIPREIRRLLSAIKWSTFYKSCTESKIDDIDSYDMIHFHRTIDLYSCKKSLKNYKGKILLTSHTPSASFVEIISGLSPIYRALFSRGLSLLEKVDEFAFDRADTLIFPCKDSLEPYAHTWKNFEKVFAQNEHKFNYVPTGIKPCFSNRSPDEIREQYSIPNDAFVLTYVGRHNVVKGYDSLIRVGKKILERFSNVYILVAGKEEPIKGPKHPRWIEVGWTNAPHDLISAADAFVLPNKETYFDLILLEVLSLGKPVLLTDTGGNKFFHQFNSNDLLYYENDDEFATQLKALVNRKKINNNVLFSEDNKRIFFNNFTADAFFANYKDILLRL